VSIQQKALTLLLEVCELEAAERAARRIARLQAAAKLPPGKTFARRVISLACPHARPPHAIVTAAA
jgi:hypothetical protein